MDWVLDAYPKLELTDQPPQKASVSLWGILLLR